ncbi:MAG: transposase family protein [Proteobacteria bacterium]|nr:transposase family protein [Pseudomonadota bacterium]
MPDKEPARLGRPEVIPPAARIALRLCYEEHVHQWGPTVLACWAERERLGKLSAKTIDKVIHDLKPKREEKPRPDRYDITSPMVMWSEDGTGFKENHRKKELMVLQDECARYKVHTRLANGPASEKDVLIYLREAFEKHGAPLVLKQDNAAYQNTEAVQKLCEEYGVLILNSPPGYPPYNGKIERGMRDIKGYVRGLKRRNKGENLQQQIGLAIKDLNEDRPRPVLKGRTSKEVFEQRSIRLPSRKQFRIRVKTRQIELEEKARDRRELHAARRRAVKEVLLHYDLLKWKGDTSTYLNAKRVTN